MIPIGLRGILRGTTEAIAYAGLHPARPTVVMLAAVILLIGANIPSVSAHAVLMDQYPEEQTTLAASPTEIRLDFNEVVVPVSVRILDARGQAITAPDAVSTIDTSVHVQMPKALPPGSYVVTYRVVSADSHPVAGSFVFFVGRASADQGGLTGAAGFPDESLWTFVVTAARGLFYGALLVAAGGALFLSLVARHSGVLPQDRRVVLAASMLAAFSGIIGVGATGALLAGVALNQFLEPGIWRIGWQTSLGTTTMVAVLGLLIIAAGINASRRRLRSAVLMSGAVMAMGSLMISGHAATAPPRWLATPAIGLHVLCAAYWIGALLPLRHRLDIAAPEQVARLVTRFSMIAIRAVTVLFICGVIIGALQVVIPPAMIETTYGQLLLVKLLLFAGLLLVATINKYRLTPMLARGEPSAVTSLRRAITAEIALASGIVIATALLGQVSPPRAVFLEDRAHSHRQDWSRPIAIKSSTGDRSAVIAAKPAMAGSNSLSIAMNDADGTPLTVLNVTVSLANALLGIEPHEYAAVAQNKGRYIVEHAQFPIAGTWTVAVKATVSEFEETVFTVELPIE